MSPCLLRFGLFACGALATSQTPLQLELVAAGLVRPVHVVAPPGDLQRLFVVEQPGRVRIVRNGVLLPTPFLDLTAGFVVSFAGELGMLGFAFHPNFASNGHCYVYYTGFPWPRAYVKRFTVSATNPDVLDPASEVAILDTPLIYGNHNSGMLAFDRQGYLNISIGDGGSPAPAFPDDPQNNAQRLDTLLGKILRIDVDHPVPPLGYGIPPSNPFVGPGNPLDEIWAYGLRNPWRFSFDRLTGDRYIADVGGWNEEIDFEPANAPGGRNYGWSCMGGTHCNVGSTVCICNSAALTMPLHEYVSAIGGGAVIGGYVYRGVALPDWRGAYFFGDYVHRRIWSLRHSSGVVTQLIEHTAQLVPPAPYTFTGISAFGEDGLGELYVCNLGGQVFRIAPVTPVVVGVTPYGAGTPGCSGPHTLSADSSPVIGHPAFTLRTGQAPAPGLGIMALASLADVPGSDPLGLGFLAHVQITSPFLSLWPTNSDSSGVGLFQFAIPPSPTLAGLALHAQSIWLWNPTVCSPSPQGWSSSPGLQFVLQP